MTALTDSLLPAAQALRFDAETWEDDWHRDGLEGPSGAAMRRRKAAAHLEALHKALRNPPEITVARNDAPDAFGCEAWVARRRQPDGTHRMAFGPTVEAATLTLLDGVDRRDIPCGYVPSDAEARLLLAERDTALDQLDQAGVSL